MTPKAQATKVEKKKKDGIKLQSFYTAKKRVEKAAYRMRENICKS